MAILFVFLEPFYPVSLSNPRTIFFSYLLETGKDYILISIKNLDLYTGQISYIFLLITSYNKLYLKAPSDLQHKSYSHRRMEKIKHSPRTRWIEIYLLEFKHHRKTRDQFHPKQLLMNNRSPTDNQPHHPQAVICPIVLHGCVHVHPSKTYCIFNMCFLTNQHFTCTHLWSTLVRWRLKHRRKYAMVDWKKKLKIESGTFLYEQQPVENVDTKTTKAVHLEQEKKKKKKK